MMLNTGLLMRKPGESEYSTTRRFLVSNYGINISSDLKSLTKIYSYKAYHLAIQSEKKLVINTNIPSTKSSFTLYPYRPTKSCEYCMSIGYHTTLFDLHWMAYCPIHFKKLTRNCSKCASNWPSYSELLLSNKCECCGTRLRFKKINSYKEKKDQPYEVINLLIELHSRSYSDKINRNSIYEHCQIYYDCNRYLNDQISSNNSILIYSILNNLGALSKSELSLLNNNKIPIIPIVRKTFLTGDNYRTMDIDQDSFSFTEKASELNNLFIKLLNNTLSNQFRCEPKDEFCVNIDGVNVDFAPLVIFKVLMKKLKMTDYISTLRSRIPVMTLFNLSFSILSNKTHFIEEILRFRVDGHFRNPYLNIPNNFIIILYQAELWKISYYALRYVDLYKQQHNGSETISWQSFQDIVKKVIFSTVHSDFTLAISMDKNIMTAFLPKMLLRKSFELIPEESLLLDIDFNSHQHAQA